MIFSTNESLEDSIIRLLSLGKTTPNQIFDTITVEGKNITIQAIYKALRQLIADSIVVKSGQKLEISQEWFDKISARFAVETTIPKLADGESATYSYKSLVNLDAYWKHLMKALEVQHPNFPVFLYSPYHIWYHISDRSQSEAEYFTAFNKKGLYAFFVIGNSTPIDTAFKKKFQDNFLQIDTWDKSPLKETSYLTIIDDYVVDTILSKEVTQKIKQYYLPHIPTEQALAELNQILSGINKCKIKITRNKKKAKALRKKLFKNFYLPKEIKEKYDLF